ncbi:hypothetical protein NNC19_21065 [Clostridium sp. SHJSY1]|uniref:hypothetical protein n=1 Tax=Clostridium sp. SHJSY1 TaxID=2942483 RepID=UPI0028740F08|nr:hypothetical protein [Clostridium sp. SHJSY1]MDS0528183.1 hypothetical protein [Clostridium sp. SHJSY1]
MWFNNNIVNIETHKDISKRSRFKKIINIINDNKLVAIIFISIIALIIRMNYLNNAGGDYDGFLSDWSKYLRDNGGFKAITSVETDYNAIYLYFLALFTYIPIKDLYLIKFLSFTFDFIMALAGYFLISYFKKDSHNKNIYQIAVFSGILLMPTVILNSSRWVQCDSIYTAFLFFSLYFIVKKKYNISFILYGVAITFKLQAIFLFPAYGIIYLKNREFSILKFLWIPLINIILYIPAVIIGKPISSILDAYICQTGKYAYKTTLGYPNIYYFFSTDNVSLIKPGIIFTMCLLSLLMLFVLYKKEKLGDKDIIELSITIIFLVTFFLPEMHDRYGYVAEVLSIIYFIIIKKDWLILLIININAIATYASYLDGVPEEVMPIIAVYQFVVVGYFMLKLISDCIKQGNSRICES